METRYYKIADSLLRLSAESFDFADTFGIFETEPEIFTGNANRNEAVPEVINIECFNKADILAESEEMSVSELLRSEDMAIFKMPTGYRIEYADTNTVRFCLIEEEGNRSRIYHNTQVCGMDLKNSIRDAFLFHLQKQGKIAIHSASILYKGKAWLFSAPSGVGKTTHVNQWRTLVSDLQDFNGDLALCYRKSDGNIVAASSPWCGTSEIYCNQIAELGGIIFLEQANENCIRVLKHFESSLRIAARCISPAWEKKQMECNLEVTEKIAEKTVNALLFCLPDTEAAAVSKGFIDRAEEKIR